MKENAKLLRRPSVQALFNGYYHDNSLAAMNGSSRGIISTEKVEYNNEYLGAK